MALARWPPARHAFKVVGHHARQIAVSLAQTLELYVAERDRMRDFGFPEVLLNPVAGIRSSFECAGALDAALPIYVMGDWAQDAPRLALPLIGELVLTWTSHIDAGLVTTEPDGSWRHDSHQLPQNVLDLGVY